MLAFIANYVYVYPYMMITVLILGLWLHLDCIYIDSGNLEIEHMDSLVTVFQLTLSSIWPLSSEVSFLII